MPGGSTCGNRAYGRLTAAYSQPKQMARQPGGQHTCAKALVWVCPATKSVKNDCRRFALLNLGGRIAVSNIMSCGKIVCACSGMVCLCGDCLGYVLRECIMKIVIRFRNFRASVRFVVGACCLYNVRCRIMYSLLLTISDSFR